MRGKNYSILLHSEQVGLTGGKMETRATLRPGEKRTKALLQEHGHRLVCVRYRYDAAARVRYKTVKLIVEQVPWEAAERVVASDGRPGRPPSLVGVRVAWGDRILQQRIRGAGGRWARAAPSGVAALRRQAVGLERPARARAGPARKCPRGLSGRTY